MNSKHLEQIQDLLKDVPFQECLVIIANLMIQLGLENISTEEPVNSNNILNVLLEDKQKHGETISNATALQGLNILLWLNNFESTNIELL